MILECPHCFTHVIPTPQNQCPACRREVTAAAVNPTNKSALAIGHLTALPPRCCDCNEPTHRYVEVTQAISHKRDERDSSPSLLLLGLLVSWVFWIVALMKGDLRERVSDILVVRLPQCPACSTRGKPAPIRVNAEEYRMTFVVHQGFKQLALSQSLGDASPERLVEAPMPATN